MKRKRWGIPLLLFAVVALGGAVFMRVRPSTEDARGTPAMAADPGRTPAARRDAGTDPESVALPGGGAPPFQPLPGWPFAALPTLAKGDEPGLRVEIQVSRRDSLEAPRRRPAVVDSGVATAPASPLWLVPAVLAGELGAGSAARGSTVPEPSVLLLLATGVAICAAAARRGRRS